MAQCRGCGAEITFAKTPDGKTIPLDLRAPVYTIERQDDGSVVATRNRDAAVTHFATCPKANDFSGSKKKEGNA